MRADTFLAGAAVTLNPNAVRRAVSLPQLTRR